MQTIFGLVADADGLATDGLRHWSTRSVDFARAQDRDVPVDRDHDHHQVGRVLHLELDRRHRLWAVAEVDDHVEASVAVKVGNEVVHVESPLYWSPTRFGAPGEVMLTWLSVTTFPARVAAQPLTLLQGRLDHPGASSRWRLQGYERDLIRRAEEESLSRRSHSGPLTVVDEPPPGYQPALLGRPAIRHSVPVGGGVLSVR